MHLRLGGALVVVALALGGGSVSFAEEDIPEKIKDYMSEATAGNMYSQNILGYIYEKSLGLPQSYVKAYEWYEKSARQGYDISQTDLGRLYKNGKGVRQDYVKAREWFEKAAAQNNTGAQFNLGLIYSNGEGVRQDKNKAKEWYGKACDKGYQAGCKNYRILNEEGF